MNLFQWFSAPDSSSITNKRNFVNVQIDAIGVGLANAASPFLPVFLARLGAGSFEVSLLSTMPAVAGFILAIPLGRLLQQQRDIVPWFSVSRLMVLSSYGLAGLVGFIIPQSDLIASILWIFALVTLPQTILSITFSVVMNAVAGPTGRFELMTRRWSILGFTTALTVFLIGQILDIEYITFPLNYQLAFIALSIGGLISYYFSSRIDIPKSAPPPPEKGVSIKRNIQTYVNLIGSQKPFVSFVVKRFVYTSGIYLAVPLLPIYFVRDVNATDGWIATINTSQTAVMILGYFFWIRQSRLRGSRWVLLASTFGLAFYPILVALTRQVWLIALYAGFSGFFLAGLNLIFFDELMRKVPVEYSATFVSVAQSLEYFAMMLAPLLASTLDGLIGASITLIISGLIRLISFSLFAFEKTKPEPQPA